MKIQMRTEEPIEDTVAAAAGAAALAELEAEIAGVDLAERERQAAATRDRALRVTLQEAASAEASLRRLRSDLATLDQALASLGKTARQVDLIPDGVTGAQPGVPLGIGDTRSTVHVPDVGALLADIIAASTPKIQERRGRVVEEIGLRERDLADAQARALDLRR